jgi:hypothetical protein
MLGGSDALGGNRMAEAGAIYEVAPHKLGWPEPADLTDLEVVHSPGPDFFIPEDFGSRSN